MLYNATNTYVAINGKWLNDAVSITYQQQGGVDPLYGYMDREFRDVARKNNIVAGTIGIYFKEHDKFFRYLTRAGADEAISEREQEQQRIRSQVQAAVDAGTVASLLSTIDLNSDQFALYRQELQKILGVTRPVTNQRDDRPANADVLGDSGHQLLHQTQGARIDIYYGDRPVSTVRRDNGVEVTAHALANQSEIESLYGVWIIGRAKTPIENSPRQGADPVMEFYSFIAKGITRPY